MDASEESDLIVDLNKHYTTFPVDRATELLHQLAEVDWCLDIYVVVGLGRLRFAGIPYEASKPSSTTIYADWDPSGVIFTIVSAPSRTESFRSSLANAALSFSYLVDRLAPCPATRPQLRRRIELP